MMPGHPPCRERGAWPRDRHRPAHAGGASRVSSPPVAAVRRPLAPAASGQGAGVAGGHRARCSRSSRCSASTSWAGSRSLWDALTGIGLGYLLAGWTLQTAQTTLTAFGWYSILRVAFPDGRVAYLQILAAYAAGVALNGFLPANIGTFVMLLMYVAIIPGANLPGVLGGMVVQKIFFTVAGAFVYVYLFLSVPGSLDLQLPALHDHPVLILGLDRRRGDAAGHPRPDLLAQAQRALGQGRAGRRDPRPAARVRAPGGAAVVRSVAGQARRDRRLPRRLRHHRHLPHRDVGHGRQLDRQHRLGHPRRRRRQPGHQRRRAQRRHRRRHRDRLLARSATRDHRLEHRLRRRARRLGVRLDRREAPRRAVLHRRQGQGRRAEGPARPDQGDQTRRAGSADTAATRRRRPKR